jgi:hypothetical protein
VKITRKRKKRIYLEKLRGYETERLKKEDILLTRKEKNVRNKIVSSFKSKMIDIVGKFNNFYKKHKN